MDKPTLTFGSLFSGIGGLDLGLERAGLQCAWQVEIDDYATKVLAKHWPNTPRFRDVRECGEHNLTHVDLIAGGFPCQPHSQAGERKASKDERDLWPEFYRLICELEPRWVVAENVLGLLSSEDGAFFGAVLRDLAKAGYDARWSVLSAAQFGAPHLRERVILVAHASSQRRQQITRGTHGDESANERGTTPHDHQSTGAGKSNGSGYVAHTNSNDGRRTQRANAGGMAGACGADTEGQGYSQWDAHQCGGSPLAYAGSPEWWAGTEGWRHVLDWADAGWQKATGGFEFCGEELANPDFQGLEVGQRLGGNTFTQCTSTERGSDCANRTWAVESCLGRAASRLPGWLDGYHWPAGPGQQQYEWEEPRVTTEKVANRTARLKGLGNAVVPALAEYIGRQIMAAEAERLVSYAHQ